MPVSLLACPPGVLGDRVVFLLFDADQRTPTLVESEKQVSDCVIVCVCSGTLVSVRC